MTIQHARSTAVKRLKSATDPVIGGYLVVFGSPEERDLYGDYFTPETDLWLGEYKNQPVLYDHTLSDLPIDFPQDAPRKFKLGHLIRAVVDSIGLWVEGVVNEHNDWVEAVLSLINQGTMHWSSGSVPHLVTYSPDNAILSWPVIEASITPTPAEPRKTDIVRLKHFVTTQDAPEATAPEAARHPTPGLVQLDRLEKVENQTMLTIDEKTVKAVVWAIADANLDSLKSAIDAYKQDGGNAIADLVRPMAEELAAAAGTDADTATQYLIAFVAEHATGGSPPEPDMPEDAPPAGGDGAPLMSADVQRIAEKAAREAVQGLLKPTPDGAFMTPQKKNVNIALAKTAPFSWIRTVRAITQNDRATLKAMGINPDTAGGYMVPPERSTEVIELLRSGAPVLGLCRQLPMASDTLPVPKLTGGSTAYWTAENSQLTDSTPSAGEITLVAKKLTAMVKISNEWLEDSDPAMEAMIREDIVQTLAEAVDNAILEGAGVNSEPRGLANIAGVTKVALNAAPTAENVIDMISRVEVANVNANPMWNFVFHPRDKAVLAKLAATTSGDYLWTELGLPGHTLVGGYPTTLRGYPYVTTTQVSIDTDNNDETKIYFGQFNDVVVGMRKSLELMATNVGGDSFEYDQTWIRAIMRLDVNIRHDESIEILTDVRTS
jgi:HK97 family phage major capsid protein